MDSRPWHWQHSGQKATQSLAAAIIQEHYDAVDCPETQNPWENEEAGDIANKVQSDSRAVLKDEQVQDQKLCFGI